MKKPTRMSREQKFRRFQFATMTDPNLPLPKMSKDEKHFYDSMAERAKYLNGAQLMNGPGYYLDKKLRQFVLEYNNRVFMGHGSQQPMSFKIMQDFVEPDDIALVLKILSEKHYSFDVNFILEELTDPAKNRDPAKLYELEEKRIYHVAITGGFEELQFSGVDSLALFGWAFVRHGDEVSIFLLGAKGEPDQKLDPINASEFSLYPGKHFLKDAMGESIDRNHEEFFDLEHLYPVVFLSKIDLSRKTTILRYILTERRDAFDVVCDDRQMYTELRTGPETHSIEKVSKLFDRAHEQLSQNSKIFALMNELPFVALGVEENDDLKIIRAPTDIHLNSHKTQIRKMKKVLSSIETPNFIQIGTIARATQPPYSTIIKSNYFKVEQRGYWKSLEMGQYGTGKNGDRVNGKTWVTVQESWEESFGFSPPENPTAVEVTRGANLDEVGEVYVMRSPQHPKDVYKVGFTTKTAETRAAQLEATSGQPDQFGVMHSWTVKEPRRIEGIVHDRLAQYRTNPRREFFKVKYTNIHSTIEQVISELDASLES